jgi:putative ABC transport system permease protein
LVSRLDRKLLRDLKRLAPQLLAIVFVLAAGLSMLVMSGGLISGLEQARDSFYNDQRMAHLAASAVRVPNSLAPRIAALPGVAALEARVSGVVSLSLEGTTAALSARALSLPIRGRPSVNDLTLKVGRWPDPGRPAEAILNSAFAESNDIEVGARIPAILKGKRQVLEVVGIADSPEFVFVAPPGEIFPQPDRFGVVWIGLEGLARALDMDGAFNDVAIRLVPGTWVEEVSAAVDTLLASHGGQGTYGRDRMLSDRFVTEELQQLRTMALYLPLTFLLVAAFLVNVTLSRLVATERGNIGLLKSFGFHSVAAGWHYAKLALAVALMGGLGAVALGIWIGVQMSAVYLQVYRFPTLAYQIEPSVIATAFAIGIAACLVGAARAVAKVISLAPAAALAPPAPIPFRGSIELDRWLARFDARSRIVARRILRFPRRAATTVIGVALAMALLIVANSFPASMREMLRVNFDLVNRQSATLTFAEARGTDVLSDVARLPGVMAVEPVRVREAVFQVGSTRVREGLIGLIEQPEFARLLDEQLAPLSVRGDGVTLSRRLAEKLGVDAGAMVRVELTDGEREVRNLPVTHIADTWLGGSAYMEIGAMARAFEEAERISAVHVLVDPDKRTVLEAAVKATPVIVSASFTADARASQEALFEQGVGFMAALFTAFAALMAVGVTYSAARVTLSEQERDLATLQVLGFSRRECSVVLLAELAALGALAVPSGLFLGWQLASVLMRAFETDLFTLPLVVEIDKYAESALFVMLCVAIATFIVRRGIDQLSLTETLKARS